MNKIFEALDTLYKSGSRLVEDETTNISKEDFKKEKIKTYTEKIGETLRAENYNTENGDLSLICKVEEILPPYYQNQYRRTEMTDTKYGIPQWFEDKMRFTLGFDQTSNNRWVKKLKNSKYNKSFEVVVKFEVTAKDPSGEVYGDVEIKNIKDIKNSSEPTTQEIKESYYSDLKNNEGIQSYFDLLMNDEPQSEYDKMCMKYMETHDKLRKQLAELRDKYAGDTKNPEFIKEYKRIAKEDEKNMYFYQDIESIPEEERGPLYQEWLEIQKANNDEFAQARGYDSYEDYEKDSFGLNKLSSMNEGMLWGEDKEYDEKMAKIMNGYVQQLIEEFKSLGWEYNDEASKYGHYYFTKNGFKVDYCDNVDKVGNADVSSDLLKGQNKPEDIDEYRDVDDDYFFIDFNWSHPSARKVASYLNRLADEKKIDEYEISFYNSNKSKLNEARYIYDDEADYTEDLNNLSVALDDFMYNEAPKYVGKPQYYYDYQWADTKFLKAARDYIASKTGYIITDKVSHAHDIGNNNAYEVMKQTDNSFEHIGYLNWNDDMYGDEVCIYLTNSRDKSIKGSKTYYIGYDQIRCGKKVIFKKELKESATDEWFKTALTEDIIAQLNQRLRNVKTFDEFKEIEKDMFDSGAGLNFRTRRAHWLAQSFTDMGDGYVHYLLGDHVSVRKQKLTDLWKYIEVAEYWR